jgi:hypothetical protein
LVVKLAAASWVGLQRSRKSVNAPVDAIVQTTSEFAQNFCA